MKDVKVTRKPYDLWTKYESDLFTRRLAYFCAQRSGRFSDQFCNWVCSNDTEALCTFNVDYRYSDNPRELAYARQTLAFYSKDADLELCDTEKAMKESFIKTEMQCKATNKRWSSLFHNGTLEFHCDSIVFKLRRKIYEILGDCPTLDELDFAFGPGVNVGVKKDEVSSRWKLRVTPTHTDALGKSMEMICRDLPHVFSLHKGVSNTVVGILRSVAKNALTDRSIIIEPTLHTPYQKGVGSCMKKRLLMFGCNLRKQSINHRLALRGSKDGEIVTLDVRNASNTVALLVPYHLFPEDWFNLLDQLRTPVIDVGGGKKIELEMFSSMGNGFTFELESLIFYALALVVADEYQASLSDISVYGDDIVIPRNMARRYIKCLTFLGFETNVKKSFLSGPFRESCGCDYFLGTDIRPFYKKGRWTKARVVGLLNHDANHLNLFDDLRSNLELAVSDVFPYGPKGYGDGCIQLESYDPFLIHWLRPCNRTKKQQYVHGQRDGTLFDFVIKVPLKDFERYQKLTIEDSVFPLYTIAQKPPEIPGYLRRKGSGWVYMGDDGGRRYFISLAEYVKSSVILEMNDDLKDRETDPYVVQGGWDSKKVSIYELPGILR